MSAGAGHRFLRRRGEAATLRHSTSSSLDTWRDPIGVDAARATWAKVRPLSQPVTVTVNGNEVEATTEVWIPASELVLFTDGEELPQIDVGGKTYTIGDAGPHERPGVQRLYCRVA